MGHFLALAIEAEQEKIQIFVKKQFVRAGKLTFPEIETMMKH